MSLKLDALEPCVLLPGPRSLLARPSMSSAACTASAGQYNLACPLAFPVDTAGGLRLFPGGDSAPCLPPTTLAGLPATLPPVRLEPGIGAIIPKGTEDIGTTPGDPAPSDSDEGEGIEGIEPCGDVVADSEADALADADM